MSQLLRVRHEQRTDQAQTRLRGTSLLPYHLLLLLTTVIWGSIHPISKQLLAAGLSPTQISLSPLALAAVAMLAITLASGKLWRLRRLSRRDLLSVIGLGLCGYFASPYLSVNGLRYLPAATNGLLANSSPLFVALFMPLLLRERPGRWALIGLLAGFAGVSLLASSRGSIGSGEMPLIGLLLSLGAGASWALYTALGRWSTARLDPSLVTLISSAVSVPPLLTIAIAEGQLADALAAPPWVLLGLIWLGLVGTGLTFFVWTASLRRLHAASVSAYSYLIPVFGVLFAFLLLGEVPNLLFALGAALILVGVWAAQR